MKRVLIPFLLGGFLFGCSWNANPSAWQAPPPDAAASLSIPPRPGILNVFAAASLTEAFNEIAETFQAAHPSIAVRFNFAGSQTLQAQIEGGAPADLFATANKTNLDALISAGYIDQGDTQLLLANNLVIIVPQSNPSQIESLRDLARPNVKLVLADDTVPAGKYARQILENAGRDPSYEKGFASQVLANVVSHEVDVKQVVAKVQLGEADAGIAYASDPLAAPDLLSITIPAEINVVAKYFIAPIRESANLDLARQFMEYVLSPDGQVILQKWGFSPVR